MIAGDVDDQQMFVEMDRENRQRKDLRPYEQGMMYGHALKEDVPLGQKDGRGTWSESWINGADFGLGAST